MREKKQERRLRITLVLAVVAPCFVFAVCALIYIGETRRYRGTKPELLNVWFGEKDNVIRFAPDGTGMGHIGKQSVFFRWSESGGTLRLYFEPRDKPLYLIVCQSIAELCGNPTSSESNRIESITRDTMTLIDSRTGEELRFYTEKPKAE